MSAERLYDAIVANSYELVKSYLENGADPNACPRLPLLADVLAGDLLRPDKVRTGCFVAASNGDPFIHKFTPLHAAVVNSYHNHCNYGRYHSDYSNGEAKAKIPLAILDLLLNYGADTAAEASYFGVCDFDNNCLQPCPRPMTAADLSAFLKKYKSRYESDAEAQVNILDKAIAALTTAGNEVGSGNPQTVPVAKSVAEMYRKLLLSEDFSDVHFVCEDGTTLHAHKVILASSSEYFANYFKGPWDDLAEHKNGIWKSTNSPNLMRAVLAFMYTGKVPASLIENDSFGMLSVATQYGLTALIKMSETACIRGLDEDSAKSTIQVAYLHSSQPLRSACFRFIRNNAHVLARPDMMALAGQDPDLWQDLTEQITPPSKRARHM